MHVFYEQLAPFWHLLSPVEDYAEEAGEYLRVLDERHPSARTLLELGSGGGCNAFHLKRRYALTLTDLSPAMLAASARINPECEHLPGDMRTLSLARTFDIVFAHDALDYMLDEAALAAVLDTARRHLAPGGLVLFVPDHVAERYEPGTDCGGSDGDDGRSLRYLEWMAELPEGATQGVTHYSFLVRDLDGSVRHYYEAHPFGVFARASWQQLFERCGFAVEIVEERTSDDRTPRLLFLGRLR
jgi:SAM-dependent methyltransferase